MPATERRRILIVEDDAALRQSLAGNLREHGYTVDEAGNAAEGEYYAREFASGLAIIDLGLPDRPGAELVVKRVFDINTIGSLRVSEAFLDNVARALRGRPRCPS